MDAQIRCLIPVPTKRPEIAKLAAGIFTPENEGLVVDCNAERREQSHFRCLRPVGENSRTPRSSTEHQVFGDRDSTGSRQSRASIRLGQIVDTQLP